MTGVNEIDMIQPPLYEMQRLKHILIINFLKCANPKYMLSPKMQFRVFYNILLKLMWKSAD